MRQISVPYRSQWDEDANQNEADCGPTCLAMVLNYFGTAMTPNQIYDFLPPKMPTDFTTFGELMNAAAQNGLTLSYRNFGDKETALRQLRANLDAGVPVIALIKYAAWKETTGNMFDWGHFVVVTGYEGEEIMFHDPLFGLWQRRSLGAHFRLPAATFCAGWGGFPADENPNWVGAIAGSSAAPPSPPATPPEEITREPVNELPPASSTPIPQPHTPDTRRRIRALAAYRWSEPPDFDQPDEVAPWLTHLGDFAETTVTHTVGAGDTLVGLAGRYYGEQHRWRAIYAFNELNREGLWAGERLEIPQVGSSGAHQNPALPHDTLAKAKSAEAFFDPNRAAGDYNALGVFTVGIGALNEGGATNE